MSQMITRARELRQTQTPYEAKLWKLLRNRQLEGFKFRRQTPIGLYFADFCCLAEKLVIELDGQSHDERAQYDHERDEFLADNGYRTIRILNRDLISNPEGVWLTIETALKQTQTATEKNSK